MADGGGKWVGLVDAQPLALAAAHLCSIYGLRKIESWGRKIEMRVLILFGCGCGLGLGLAPRIQDSGLEIAASERLGKRDV